MIAFVIVQTPLPSFFLVPFFFLIVGKYTLHIFCHLNHF